MLFKRVMQIILVCTQILIGSVKHGDGKFKVAANGSAFVLYGMAEQPVIRLQHIEDTAGSSVIYTF